MEDGQKELVNPSISLLEYYAKFVLLQTFVSSITALQRFRTERFYVDGIEENLATTDESGKQRFRMPGPYLFLGQHVAWDDFVNIPPIWSMFPEKTLFTGPARNDYMREVLNNHPTWGVVGDRVVNPLLGLLFFPIYRTWTVKDSSPEELQKMQDHNRTSLEQVVCAYQKGINIAMMPEGTSKTDGRIAKIRSGAYIYATGTEIKPWCIHFGNTYDYFAGDKPHVFVRFGVPYKHEAIPIQEGEAPDEYRKRDMAVFNGRIREEFLDLSTITATQLVAAVVYDMRDRKYLLNKFGLAVVVGKLVEGLRDRQVFVDPALSNFDKVQQRVDGIIDTLEAEKYIT